MSHKGCEQYIEELTGSQPISAECSSHLAGCDSCRELMATVRAMRQEPSAYSSQAMEGFQKRVWEKVENAPVPHYLQEGSLTASNALSFSKGWILAGMGVVLLVATMVFSPTAGKNTDSKTGEQEIQVAFPGGEAKKLGLGSSFFLASSSAILTGPDGSVIQVQGPSEILMGERGFDLKRGNLVVKPSPGVHPFEGKTPHGTIQGSNGIFECQTSETQTLVSVLSGAFQVTSHTGESQKISANRQCSMTTVSAKEGVIGSAPEKPISNLQGE